MKTIYISDDGQLYKVKDIDALLAALNNEQFEALLFNTCLEYHIGKALNHLVKSGTLKQVSGEPSPIRTLKHSINVLSELGKAKIGEDKINEVLKKTENWYINENFKEVPCPK